MSDIGKEITFFEEIRESLEAKHMGKWVLIHNMKLIDVYDSFEKAAESAVHNFGAGPYLIRQVGAPPLTLPASVVYCFNYD